MELNHLLDLISELQANTEFKYVRGDTKCTYLSLDRSQPRVFTLTEKKEEHSISPTYLEDLANKINPKEPFNISSLMNNRGTNRPIIETVLAHTSEFFWIKKGNSIYVIWDPDMKHKPGNLVEYPDSNLPILDQTTTLETEENTLRKKFLDIDSASNTILYGPPGTGKTYEMQKIFAGYPEGNRSVITFHQSYSYEEFIIGLKAKTTEDNKIEYSYEKGVFYNACERAAVLAGYSSLAECCTDTKEGRYAKFAAVAEDKSKQFLFCIDEIKRAKISVVFGDLICLIEENKRLGAQNEMIVRLPYTQELFGVPANLRLLGTMNTADRSIQILDTALRRRFQFNEYLPDYDVLRNKKARDILHKINDRIRALLGQDRQMGHSYFYDIEASAADESIRILKALTNKIIPLLQEYFYNDVEKIRFVLGEKDRIPDEHSFYIEDGDATAAFSRYDSDSEETSFYILNTEGIESASMSNESASAFIDHITA